MRTDLRGEAGFRNISQMRILSPREGEYLPRVTQRVSSRWS